MENNRAGRILAIARTPKIERHTKERRNDSIDDDSWLAFPRVGGTRFLPGLPRVLGLIYVYLCAFRISGVEKTVGRVILAWLVASPDDYPEVGVEPGARRNKYVDKYPPYLLVRVQDTDYKKRIALSSFFQHFRGDNCVRPPLPEKAEKVENSATRRVFFRDCHP